MKKNTIVWTFFASVKLALFTLGCLAVTSIIGTILPQKEPISLYINRFGPQAAQFIEIFHLDSMYSAPWFIALLVLLCINLTICSLDRFPTAWKLVRRDNLAIPLERIMKTGQPLSLSTHHSLEKASTIIADALSTMGWKARRKDDKAMSLFFCQKGPFSRMGVYLVHISILVIFAGALYGELTGFKGSILLPEMKSSDTIFATGSDDIIDLGFTVRCDKFEIDFYSNNMPKDYRSSLVILENGEEVVKKDIEVNSPLHYKGITFYQSSYQGFRDFLFLITPEDGAAHSFSGHFQKEIHWEKERVRFGILNGEGIGDRITRLKIWFDDDDGPPSEFWMDAAEEVKIQRKSQSYMFMAKQRYATGLQVAKDPGVLIVYLGCAMMLLGLYMAFFLSHRRIWLIVQTEQSVTTIDLRATSNKNKRGFQSQCESFVRTIQEKLETEK